MGHPQKYGVVLDAGSSVRLASLLLDPLDATQPCAGTKQSLTNVFYRGRAYTYTAGTN